jgi:hypothetical protein
MGHEPDRTKALDELLLSATLDAKAAPSGARTVAHVLRAAAARMPGRIASEEATTIAAMTAILRSPALDEAGLVEGATARAPRASAVAWLWASGVSNAQR